MSKEYFVLFANCMPVKGSLRSSIIDLQRQEVHLIPNDLCDLMLKHPASSLEEINKAYPNDTEVILEYLEFLESKELVFRTNYPEKFPRLEMNWDYPSHITNAIIELNCNLMPLYGRVVQELDKFLCSYLELRIYDWTLEVDKTIKKFIDLFDGKVTHSIQLKVSGNDDLSYFQKLMDTYPRISDVQVYNTSKPSISSIETTSYPLQRKACGKIDVKYFTPNITHFMESQMHNSCLNRKISVDVRGNIKNCPSMQASFGNIKDTTLEEAIQKPGFKKYWDVSKDQIKGCQDCEFRYICTDCMAYNEDPNNDLSKPLKCGYNPYTGEWSEWSTNPLKQKAIDFYGMGDLVKK